MCVVLVLILLFLLVRERKLERFVRMKVGQLFHKKSGSQGDNQASSFGCPHATFGCQGHFNFAILSV